MRSTDEDSGTRTHLQLTLYKSMSLPIPLPARTGGDAASCLSSGWNLEVLLQFSLGGTHVSA